ncbi:hypothetical protein FRC07_008075 [Ceratobasidium sp. 392]|nr:hypothetical protein FRC07_008075 [Ceratobasidium sp. 392]
MSEFFKTKRSVTLVLISDEKEGKRKTDLIALLHAALSEKTSKEFVNEKYSPPTPDSSSRYRIEAKDGLVVNILDTPGLDAEGTQADTITQAVTMLSTVDAFVVVLDQSKPELGGGITHLLPKLSAAFSRPIEKSVIFLVTSPEYRAGCELSKLNGLPPWVGEGQMVGRPIPDIVGIRNQLRSRFKEEAVLLRRFVDPFKWSITRLEPLWKFINSSSVQACEMKNLYLRAAGVESQIYQIIAGDRTLKDDQALGRITALVNEYQLISASPDFITHLELVIELLRTWRENTGMEASILELEKARDELWASKNRNDQYLKWYIVSEAF